MSEAPAFRRGAEAAQAAAKGTAFQRTQFLNMDDGEVVILRFLTEPTDWITVQQHQMIPTKAKPDGYEGNWPARLPAVCRLDEAFTGPGIYKDCYICANIVNPPKVKKPGARTWALACLREEVKEDGKVVGYKDQTRTVTKKKKDSEETEEIEEKAIVVLNLGWQNFFSILKGLAEFHGGTVCDRDYWVKRNGKDTTTTYNIIALPDQVKIDGEVLCPSHPQWAKRYHTDIDLGEEVSSRASDDFYARFFDPTKTVSDKGEIKESTSAPTPSSNDVDQAQLAAIAARVKGHGAGGDETPAGVAVADANNDAPSAPASSGMKDFG